MTTPFDFLRSRTIWYFALIFAIYLFTGCNNFWTPCTETPDEAFCQESANTDGGGKIDQASDKPIGPTRKFEEKAFIKVDPNNLKYVGMKGTTPVFLRDLTNGKSSWVAFQLNLLHSDLAERVKTNTDWAGFPAAVPEHDFLNAPVLVSGGTFYYLSTFSKRVYSFDPKIEVLVGVERTDSVQYFRHPEQNALAVTTKPPSGFSSAILIRWPSGGAIQPKYSNAPATALVMGDLDATDTVKNGTELIWSTEKAIMEVRHQGGPDDPSYPDSLLKIGLQEAIDRNEKDGPIQGGFVAKLNDDRFTDFVYARGSKLFVTSYIGRSESGIGLFADWPKEGLPSLPLERVKSIQAIDLTKEGYPELVVETDQAVHFYLSIP
ncbi:MAG: hypothetical protein JNM83_13195 [Myxococcales bacterium]|jgi:hypothetical protein|nr:hypothetical protein [Myxococcales bacterium]